MTDQEKFLQQFEDVSKGISKYITLDSLQIGTPYEIVRFRLHDSVYGRCLIVDLAVGFWLVLPKRIGDLVGNEEQVGILNSQHFWMIFKGRHEHYRKMAIIEFKTMEQFMEEQVDLDIDLPNIQFNVESLDVGTQVHEVGTQTEEVKPSEKEHKKDDQRPKGGAVPKIKTKKERK